MYPTPSTPFISLIFSLSSFAIFHFGANPITIYGEQCGKSIAGRLHQILNGSASPDARNKLMRAHTDAHRHTHSHTHSYSFTQTVDDTPLFTQLTSKKQHRQQRSLCRPLPPSSSTWRFSHSHAGSQIYVHFILFLLAFVCRMHISLSFSFSFTLEHFITLHLLLLLNFSTALPCPHCPNNVAVSPVL